MSNVSNKKKNEDRKKYDEERFNLLYPLISKLIKKFELKETITEHVINDVVYQIRKFGDMVEMGLSSESPIFPTLVFKEKNNEKAELLYFRISSEFDRNIIIAVD
jgi:hypothetical protein